MQFVTAVAAMLGTWAGLTLTEGNKFLEELLIAGTSGGFIYIATLGALATVMSSKKRVTLGQTLIEVLLICLGVALMVAVALSEEHDHAHGDHHGLSGATLADIVLSSPHGHHEHDHQHHGHSHDHHH